MAEKSKESRIKTSRSGAELESELQRRITELDEARAREVAIAEVLQVINSSPGDLAPVFDTMLERAMRLCDGTNGALYGYNGDVIHRIAARGAEGYVNWVLEGDAIGLPAETPLGIALMRGQIAHVLDSRETRAYQLYDRYRSQVDAGDIRTALVVPLRKDEAIRGAIAVFRQEVRPFTERQIALVQNFAAQAVIAMENARLLTETREALEQQTATTEVLQVINSSPGNLMPVWDAMLEKAIRLCEAAAGILWAYDGERFHAVAQHGVPYDLMAEYRSNPNPVPTAALEAVVRGENVVRNDDLSKNRGAELSVYVGGMRTGFLVAMRKGDTLLGAIRIFRQNARPFSDKQIALVQNFAAQAVIAMENARLLGELRERNAEIAAWNKELEARVAAQLAELEQTGKLRRFLAPQLADLIVAQGNESILESHRREIVVVFCDLRGFTPFAEHTEPEEVMALLKEYHATLGPIIARFEGTIDHYSGDGIMVFFNDPLPAPDPARRAIDMAVAMREAAQTLQQTWRRRGHDLGFGVGISQGYATLGQIGFAERIDYTAIGTITTIAERLCHEAKDGQILISRRVATAVQDSVALEEIGELSLKGLSQMGGAFNVIQSQAAVSSATASALHRSEERLKGGADGTIFISCASPDAEAAKRISAVLEQQGLRCWLSGRDIQAGENFQEAITQAIRTAGAVLLVFSGNTNSSLEVKKEIALAGHYRVTVVPVRIADAVPDDAFTYELAVRQWIDLFPDWEPAVDRLLLILRGLPG